MWVFYQNSAAFRDQVPHSGARIPSRIEARGLRVPKRCVAIVEMGRLNSSDCMNIVPYSRELEYREADPEFKILPSSIADSLLTFFFFTLTSLFPK